MSSWKWADGRKYISSPNGWVEIPYPPPDSWIYGTALPPPPSRHSADDYKGIAERLKQLGYRGWITG
jgi:hypothetical protein